MKQALSTFHHLAVSQTPVLQSVRDPGPCRSSSLTIFWLLFACCLYGWGLEQITDNCSTLLQRRPAPSCLGPQLVRKGRDRNWAPVTQQSWQYDIYIGCQGKIRDSSYFSLPLPTYWQFSTVSRPPFLIFPICERNPPETVTQIECAPLSLFCQYNRFYLKMSLYFGIPFF